MYRVYELTWKATDGNSRTKVIVLNKWFSKRKLCGLMWTFAAEDYARFLLENNIVQVPEPDDYFDDPDPIDINNSINLYAQQNDIHFVFNYKQINNK